MSTWQTFALLAASHVLAFCWGHIRGGRDTQEDGWAICATCGGHIVHLNHWEHVMPPLQHHRPRPEQRAEVRPYLLPLLDEVAPEFVDRLKRKIERTAGTEGGGRQ